MVTFQQQIRFIDLFSGIGGFRIAFEQAAASLDLDSQCVFSSDIDKACSVAYEANFNEAPFGDIREIAAEDIPDHNVLLAGFPCQSFSIIGSGAGFKDKVVGTLFFDIARILEAKKPDAFVLENVRGLVNHDKGRTLRIIMDTLQELGYHAQNCVLNALDFGLPQKRERVFIVGFSRDTPQFQWPEGGIPMKPLSSILESKVAKRYWASDYIREKRHSAHKAEIRPSIWHENKSGNISSNAFSMALRAGASYNYLLVNGDRRLTEREMLRLQGFPETFKVVCSYTQTRRQVGNAVPIPVARAVISQVLKSLKMHKLPMGVSAK